MRSFAASFVLVLFVVLPCGFAQQDPNDPEQEPFQEEEDSVQFSISGEVNAHYRWSQEDRFPLLFFPDDFIPAGQPNVAMSTVSPGSHIEISRATVFLEASFPRSIFARVRIDFIDIYNRNPTSTDRNVDVDEAYLRFGQKYESLEPFEGSHMYALFGKAPKFERQLLRRLESYGLVGTAFNRFNDLQLQVGGSIGSHFYFRTQVSSGNPTFFRDPNALAGDNGIEMPPNPTLPFGTGFPIFYHAEVEEVDVSDNLEVGGAGGIRFVSEDQTKGVDFLVYYYQKTLSEEAQLHGTFYEGDLDILNGAGASLPIEGDQRKELGFNFDMQLGELGFFLQYVDEEAASLPRTGIEAELAYSIVTGDRGDPQALFTFVEPVFRYSRIDNDFSAPPGFVAPSVAWDWTKIDLGVRIGIMQNISLIMEYAFHDITAARTINHNEFLTTLRFAFP